MKRFLLQCGLLLASLGVVSLSQQQKPGSASNALPFFKDVTKEARVDYRITCGDEVTEFLIDVNGEGAAFFDYDNDGNQDIYLVNGSSRNSQKTGKLPHDYLLRNNGDGTYTDVTTRAKLGDTEWGGGVAVGDYNNDGFLDLYVTNYGPNKLYRNNGDGTFTDVAEKAGVADPHWAIPKWSMGAAFGDADNDGYVDLFVANFSDFNYQPQLPAPSESSPCKMKGVPIACAPDKYDGQQHLFYHNNGDGTFTDYTKQAGLIRRDPGHGFAVVFSDFDNDGDQDIYVANDAGPNFYYINDGKGHFTDASVISGTSVDEFGHSQGSMGLTVGDPNNDGLPDIFITNFIDQKRTLYLNQGKNFFSDETTLFGLGAVGFHYSGWGTKFFDFDNDGWLDLFFTNGHTMEQLEPAYPNDPFAQPSYLLRNIKGQTFEDVSEATGFRTIRDKVSRGTAFADYDNDGDIDILIINKNDTPYLLRNDGGNSQHWIAIRTEGVKSNRAGLGAKVIVSGGGMTRYFEVRGSDSYLSSNDLRAHIGMGKLEEGNVEIQWPSGKIDKQSRLKVNRFYFAREGEAIIPDPRMSKFNLSKK
ncbi:MAG: CRTAC1 family protein [Terriglobia bacterium]